MKKQIRNTSTDKPERQSRKAWLGEHQIALRVSDDDIRALGWIRRNCNDPFPGILDGRDNPELAAMVLKLALSHPGTIKAWFNALYRYRRLEGLWETDQLKSMVGARAEYSQRYQAEN
jgi:hypothetical protein